jgi:hypothetical protein
MAFGRLGNDTTNARSFYNRVSNTPAVQDDETLQIIDEEVLFGEALACRGDNCHLVFIRPIIQIAQHWLVRIQRDSEELEGLGSTTPAGAKFISDMKTADEGRLCLDKTQQALLPLGARRQVQGPQQFSCSVQRITPLEAQCKCVVGVDQSRTGMFALL